MRTVSIFNQTFSADTEKAGYKKEAALKREEERKRSIELMKKKWLSQYKSLGLKKNGTGAPKGLQRLLSTCLSIGFENVFTYPLWRFTNEGKNRKVFLKMGHYRPLFLYFHLFDTVDSKQMFDINFCPWLDSNRGPLVSEATSLQTEPPRTESLHSVLEVWF